MAISVPEPNDCDLFSGTTTRTTAGCGRLAVVERMFSGRVPRPATGGLHVPPGRQLCACKEDWTKSTVNKSAAARRYTRCGGMVESDSLMSLGNVAFRRVRGRLASSSVMSSTFGGSCCIAELGWYESLPSPCRCRVPHSRIICHQASPTGCRGVT